MASDTVTRTPNARGRRRTSPLTRRILAVNMFALVILVGGAMALGQYRDRLIEAGLENLHTQARVFAGALAEGAVAIDLDGETRFDPKVARRMVRRLVEPTGARTRLFDAQGRLIADAGSGAPTVTVHVSDGDEPDLPPPSRWLLNDLERLYDVVAGRPPRLGDMPVLEEQPAMPLFAPGQAEDGAAIPWTTRDGGLMLTAATPVRLDEGVVGAVVLTMSGAAIQAAVQSVRADILHGFAAALGVTVLLSLYLAGTIVGPIRRLALAADRVRHGRGRQRIPDLGHRDDEIGELSQALSEMTDALWERLDAIERFAADVAHEIKNPLSSLRSAVETVVRIQDPERQKPLMAIIEDDVRRLDRLISDISAASRLDAELSRAEAGPVDLGAMLRMLAQVHATTAGDDPDRPRLTADLPEGVDLTVAGVEGRLVQVFQNLIANAVSFSPPGGTVALAARRDGAVVEVTVSDQGPGLPEGKTEAIFERFYSERPAGEKFGAHSGLGLSISRQIVAAHHGTIAAGNRTGEAGTVEGAVFTVRLPVRG